MTYPFIGSDTPGCDQDGNLPDFRLELFNVNIENVLVVARNLRKKFPEYMILDEDDFVAIGLAALWECTGTHKPSGKSFWAYASTRVTGSILDKIREFDPIPRSSRRLINRVVARAEEMSQSLGRPVDRREAGLDLGLPVRSLFRLMRYSQITLVRLDAVLDGHTAGSMNKLRTCDSIADSNAVDPAFACLRNEKHERIRRYLAQLNNRNQFIIVQYFWKEKTLREIANSLGITESAVSLRIKHILRKLRTIISESTEGYG